ncbi:hypothetical protein [Nocardioides sp. Arc9.136]|uniref:hypothetical protein n=1 Tax=Nocardioides sp. Arc9.136 TaxID=2996826 RepID=UPI0026650E22|nr:hypothetical protein [Nocardioides sp. Arc9.136]WKN49878.1 hypothetical protein OSR43_07050 [Nocardioides sp. Arc9.136]
MDTTGSAGVSDLGSASRVFFSFPRVTDPRRHRDYNAWHVGDHQPENRALPGVLHGDRWVRTPACRTASEVDDEAAFTGADYVAVYWFAEPARASIAEWLALGASTGEQGRRPDLAWTERRFTGFFEPVASCVAPGSPLSAPAVPFRAHPGVVLEVHRGSRPEAARDLAATPGVVGAWAFESRTSTVADQEPPAWTVILAWCAEDPLAVAAAMSPPAAGLVLRTPLLAVGADPAGWSWFDDAPR